MQCSFFCGCLSRPTMSLYPQSQAYGQVSYPPMGYSQPIPPPPGAYPYPHPPPPQPPYHVDPHSFRRDYTSQLAELTVNSRPIIQNLSMIAQGHSHLADVVVQCIEAHIRRVSFLLSLTMADELFVSSFRPHSPTLSSSAFCHSIVPSMYCRICPVFE